MHCVMRHALFPTPTFGARAFSRHDPGARRVRGTHSRYLRGRIEPTFIPTGVGITFKKGNASHRSATTKGAMHHQDANALHRGMFACHKKGRAGWRALSKSYWSWSISDRASRALRFFSSAAETWALHLPTQTTPLSCWIQNHKCALQYTHSWNDVHAEVRVALFRYAPTYRDSLRSSMRDWAH